MFRFVPHEIGASAMRVIINGSKKIMIVTKRCRKGPKHPHEVNK